MRPLYRRLLVACIASALLGGALVAAYRFSLQRLQSVLLQALGPRASVAAIELHWNRIEIMDLRIRSAPRWPAPDELRTDRVVLRPDLRSVVGGRWRVGELRIERPYVSLLRWRDGKLQVLPALLGAATPSQAQAQPAAAAPLVLIDRIVLSDASIDFFDASVRQPPHRIRLEDLQAEVRDLQLPSLDEPFRLALGAVVKGPQRDGRLRIDGQLTPARHDAKLHAQVEGMDLVDLQPYLLKLAEGGVQRGALDLFIDATVQDNRLKAPGRLVLNQVALSPSGRLAGVPQKAVMAALARDGRIELHFTLAGRLDDPAFSLNEDFATRIASALAERLGVSVGGMVEGVGGLLKGLLGR